MKADLPVARSGLVRALGPWMAMAVVVGTVIGSGIFKKPQVVAEYVPSFGLGALLWIAGGLLVILGALALAEVAVLFPRAGGNYVYLREGYGPLAGFLWAWADFWIVRGASLAALATLFTESLHDVAREVVGPDALSGLFGYWPQRALTISIILGLGVVNVRGVRWGGVVQLFITLVKIGSLLGIFALPFAVAALVPADSMVPRPNAANLTLLPAAAAGPVLSLAGVGTALLGVLWAYHGWMNIGPVAEEVRDPQRNIPLALIGGCGLIIALYLGANLAYYLIIPQNDMAQMKESTRVEATADAAPGEPAAVEDQTVAIGFCRRLLGPVGVGVAAAAVMCSVFGALNGNLLVGPRVLYALGEDGLAPRVLGEAHSRFHTPAVAIAVMAGWACVLVLAVAIGTAIWPSEQDKSHFDMLTDFAMFGAVIFETLAVTTIFIFRRRLPDAPRPYRCWGYPVVPALYVVVPLFVLWNMFTEQRREAYTGVAFIALGAGVYLLIRRRASRRLQAVT